MISYAIAVFDGKVVYMLAVFVNLYMCVCRYVCICVCMYVYMYACMHTAFGRIELKECKQGETLLLQPLAETLCTCELCKCVDV